MRRLFERLRLIGLAWHAVSWTPPDRLTVAVTVWPGAGRLDVGLIGCCSTVIARMTADASREDVRKAIAAAAEAVQREIAMRHAAAPGHVIDTTKIGRG